jgi:predicted phage baseplate assembly protein
LSSDPTARDYQVELIDSREARLKFGFGGMGWQPQPGDEFIAAFRVGSGVEGNVGVGAIAHIILPQGNEDRSKIKPDGVSNLLPAVGGQGRESLETARLLAPASLQTQARCVTLADYEHVARLHPDVAEASAHWKWVNNAHIVVLHLHRRNGLPVDRAFRDAFLDYMRPYQIVGSEIQVRGPNTWPVYLWLQFRPASYASANGLREALKAAFSDQDPAGFFYRQNFSLGQPLYRSQIITHAGRLTGIQEVRLVHFCNEPFGKERVEQVIPVPATALIGLKALEIQVESNHG